MPVNLNHPYILDSDRRSLLERPDDYPLPERARINVEMCMYRLAQVEQKLYTIQRASCAHGIVRDATERLASARWHYVRAVCFGAEDDEKLAAQLKAVAKRGVVIRALCDAAQSKLKPKKEG